MICQQLAFRSKKCINKHRYRDKANGIKHQLLNLGGVYGESFWLFPFSWILEIFWMNTGRCPSAGPWVGKIAEMVVSPWKCNGSIQSCGVKTYFLPLSLFSYDLGLEASSLWALLPCLGVEITTPPAWRAVMRNGCVDSAWTQHKIRLFSAQLSSPPPPPEIISNSRGIFKTTSASGGKQNIPAMEHRHKQKLVLQKHNVHKPYASPQKSKHPKQLFSNISTKGAFPLEGGNRRQKMLLLPAPKQKILASINSSCKN